MTWIDFPAAESDPFHFEAHALIERRAQTKFDFAPGADDALPGERPAVEV
jgi:hypothetical protein